MRLDLAPYRLTEAETAVGVRISATETFAAGEGELEYLHLYRIEGTSLRRVFSAIMSSSSHQRGPGEESESKSVLIVSKRKTNGMFDLVVKERSETRPMDHPEAKPRVGVRRTVYKWNGVHYSDKESSVGQGQITRHGSVARASQPQPKPASIVLDDCRRGTSPASWLSVDLAERAIAAATKRAAEWFDRLQEKQGLVLAARGFELCRARAGTAEVGFCAGPVVDKDGESGGCLRVGLDTMAHGARR